MDHNDGMPSSPWNTSLRADWRPVLLAALKAKGLSKRKASMRAGLNPAAISEWLNEKKLKEPSFDSLAKVARILELPLDAFADRDASLRVQPAMASVRVSSVAVVGILQAGVWQEPPMIDLHDAAQIPYIPSERAAGVEQYAWRVSGSSMNKIARDGDYVIAAKFIDLGHGPAHGDVVVCERRDGGTYEYTIKRVKFMDGEIVLMPESDDQRFQDPVWSTKERRAGIEVEATHLVIGVFRPI